MRKRSVLQLRDALAVASDPEAPIPAGAKRGNPPVPQLRRSRVIYGRETNAVEARQPLMRSDPKITVSRLRDGINGVLWQAVIRLPNANTVGNDSVGRSGRRKVRLRKPHQRQNER